MSTVPRSSRTLAHIALFASVALSGCAFFGKSEPLTPRYYTADPTATSAALARTPSAALHASGATAPMPALQLGRVLGGAHLRERIAYRSGEHELGFYEQRRWTERPDVYFRRALAHALFEERGLVHMASGAAPTLEAELTGFEELLVPRHAVQVRARVALLDARTVRFEHTFAVEQPVEKESESYAAVAAALSDALERCVDEISDRVVAELASAPARPATPAASAAP